MRAFFFLLFILPAASFAQMSRQDSVWLPLNAFLGSWEGTGGGEPGTGKYERSYAFILNKRFIEVRNKSVYPPTAQYPSGETHEDIGYISFDKARRLFVLRQFHVEGFVNQYVLDSIAADGKTLVFISEAIENIAKGWRARETYHITSDNEITENFDLAAPNKVFEPYTHVRLKRVK